MLGRTWAAGVASLTFMAAMTFGADKADDRLADRKAIAALADQFRVAFDAAKVDDLVRLFAEDARIIDDDGTTIIGREALAERFRATFADNRGLKIRLTAEPIEFVGADGAIEIGRATVTDSAGQSESTRYTVLYSRLSGTWLHRLVEETSVDPTPTEKMNELAGLVGEWVSESEEAVVHTRYEWSDERSFLLARFDVRVSGKAALSGTERIGWDPLRKQFRTWVFDSEGGHSEGNWARSANGEWIIKLVGVRADGQAASATRHLSWHGKDRIQVKVTDRTLGDDAIDEDVEFAIVRVPPKPR